MKYSKEVAANLATAKKEEAKAKLPIAKEEETRAKLAPSKAAVRRALKARQPILKRKLMIRRKITLLGKSYRSCRAKTSKHFGRAQCLSTYRDKRRVLIPEYKKARRADRAA